MPFVVREVDAFDWDVKIHVPQGDRKIVQIVRVKYRSVQPEDIQEQLKQHRESRGTEDEAAFDRRLIENVVTGWRDGDIVMEDKTPYPFSADNLVRLAAIPYVRTALIDGYFDAVSGKARKGN